MARLRLVVLPVPLIPEVVSALVIAVAMAAVVTMKMAVVICQYDRGSGNVNHCASDM